MLENETIDNIDISMTSNLKSQNKSSVIKMSNF